MALALAVVSLGFLAAAVGFGYYTRGDAPMLAAALGFCSILTALSALAYVVFSFLEKEKNYLLAKIGLVTAGVVLFVWLIMIVIAL